MTHIVKKLLSWLSNTFIFKTEPVLEDYLYDTRDSARCGVVRSLLANHTSYCLDEAKTTRLRLLTQDNPNVSKLIDIIQKIQKDLKGSLSEDIAVKPIGIEEEIPLIELMDICTRFNNPKDHELDTRDLLLMLNSRVLDGIRTSRIINYGENGLVTTIKLLSKNHWLTEHLALVVLGICKVSIADGNRIYIEPASPAKKLALDRVMFAVAFEELSLESDQITFYHVANILCKGGIKDFDYYDTLMSQVLVSLIKNWRIGIDGPVSSVFKYLKPFVAICIECYGNNRLVPRREVPKDYAYVYDIIFDHQSGLAVEDRLFDIIDNKLAPGHVNLIQGMISVAEQIAFKTDGSNWNTKENLSDWQEKYVKQRLARNSRIYVIDLEIRIENISQSVKSNFGVSSFDVDFMVRDNIAKKIYAIQLKHLKSVKTSGLLYWMSYLSNYNKKLSKAVVQLTHCKNVFHNDDNLRKKIMKKALTDKIKITENEFDDVTPVVLHNIGTIDFWKMQEGVLLYDLNTFCNILDGRLAIMSKVERDSLSSPENVKNEYEHCQPCDPDSVIHAYKNDKNFQKIKEFDLLSRVDRKIIHQDYEIIAKGLGI